MKNGCKEISVTTQIQMTRIDPLLSNKLKLYPNLIENFVNIEKNDDADYSIRIFNLQAEEIFHKTFIDRKTTLDLWFLVSGSFVIKIGVQCFKFIKI